MFLRLLKRRFAVSFCCGGSEAPRKEPHFEHFEMAMDEKNTAMCIPTLDFQWNFPSKGRTWVLLKPEIQMRGCNLAFDVALSPEILAGSFWWSVWVIFIEQLKTQHCFKDP